ncbi:MAG TPA: GAF domain-containing protein [Candidatus Thermoplasmatota archaeon]|nr:GAF domain-containing protein [Candidatus Thermoplasmatota archaeon]
MRRFENYARRILAEVGDANAQFLIESLGDHDLVALLAGLPDNKRLLRNVVATELQNRFTRKTLLAVAALDLERGDDLILPFTETLSRALRVEIACVDEVDGDHFILRGKRGLPEELARVERCRQSSMALCQAVIQSGRPLEIPDIPNHPVYHDSLAWRKFGIRSYSAVPSHGPDGAVRSVLWVASYQPRQLSDEEHYLLERVGLRINTLLGPGAAAISAKRTG